MSETKAMNDDPVSDDEAETERQPVLSTRPERPLPLLREPVKYSSVIDGQLVNAGESPITQRSEG